MSYPLGSRSALGSRLEASSVDLADARTAGTVGFLPRILVLTTLPHSRPKTHRFERVNGWYSLRLDARRSVGLPYGTYPRLILAYLTTEAVRTKSPEIDVGRSPNDFVRKLGLTPTSGPRGTTHRVQEQLQRLVSTRLSWEATKEFRSKERGAGCLAAAEPGPQRWTTRLLRRAPMWNPKLWLSRELFHEITRSAVPVDLRAIHHLGRSPLAIDIYVWLTYRMSYLHRPCHIPWEALQTQFGADYGRLRDFKRKFLAHLMDVISIYTRVCLTETSSGLLLWPSRTHIGPMH